MSSVREGDFCCPREGRISHLPNKLCHGTPPVQGWNIFHHVPAQQAWERVLTWQNMTPVTLKQGTQPTRDLAFSFSLAMFANSDANAHANGHAQLFLSLGQISTSLLW